MSFSEFKILLIDDDEDDLVHIRDLFDEIEGSQFELTWKSNYTSGLEALVQSRFDACLLDHRLGERTGLDLLRESQKLGVTCPIIILTGQGDFDVDIQAMQTGAAEYLVKSQITSPLLERSVRYAIKHALDIDELNKQKENFKTLFNSTFEGIIVHSRGTVIDVNLAAGNIFGYTPAEMTNVSLLDFFEPECRKQIKENLYGDRSLHFEGIGLRKDGTHIYVELSNRIFKIRDQTLSLVAIRDLTERKQMESQILQQDRLASLGLLASSLAHEIGTPLGIIRSRTELAERKLHENEAAKDDMKVIISQIDRITKLVNSLLNLARGQHSEMAAPVELNPIVEDVITLIKHELNQKNVSLKVNLNKTIIVKAESGPLAQVLLNLLVNSIHAIEEAKQTYKNEKVTEHSISIDVEELETVINIKVHDTGLGIPEKNFAQLFKPFFTTKAVGQGTGLGLATSYKLVHSWGGSIQVKNGPGPGATFTVTLHRAS